VQESSLHTTLKQIYCLEGDRTEYPLDGFIVDVFHGEGCVEIQTGNFSALRPKLAVLLPKYPVQLVYPISQEKWIEKTFPGQVGQPKLRRSPKKGNIYEIIKELVYITPFLLHPNLSIEIVFISEIEVQFLNGLGSWRRNGWSIIDHKLLKVFSKITIQQLRDYGLFLPQNLPICFTSQDFSIQARISRSLARKTCFVLKAIQMIEASGKQKRFNLYRKLYQ
jgi:hypothetical protein